VRLLVVRLVRGESRATGSRTNQAVVNNPNNETQLDETKPTPTAEGIRGAGIPPLAINHYLGANLKPITGITSPSAVVDLSRPLCVLYARSKDRLFLQFYYVAVIDLPLIWGCEK